MATTETPDAKTKVQAETTEREYIVFGQINGAGAASEIMWAEVGRAKAAKADEARDTVIDTLPVDEQDGPFVTIAARYWQPESFEIETTTVRKARR